MTHATVDFAGHRFEAVPTGIHEKPIFEGEAGLLGNGLISRYSSIVIDAKAGRAILSGPLQP
jgi:hypothetical protein